MPSSGEAAIWCFANAQFDQRKWRLRVDDQELELEPRPLQILLCLLYHAGETVTKKELLHTVWGHHYLSENALSNAVSKLRKALQGESHSVIVTVHRVGYRLAAPVFRHRPSQYLGPALQRHAVG